MLKNKILIGFLFFMSGIINSDDCGVSCDLGLLKYPNHLSKEIKKAFILKDEDQIRYFLEKGLIPDDQLIVFAINSHLSLSLIVDLILHSPFPLNHVFSNGISLKKLSLSDVDLYIYLLDNKVFSREDILAEYHRPFMSISKEEKIKIVKIALNRGFTAKDILTSSMLRDLIYTIDENGDFIYIEEILELLFASGFHINDHFFSSYNSWPFSTIYGDINLLFLAISQRSLFAVQQVLKHGANINISCNFRINDHSEANQAITPLLFALEKRREVQTSSIDKIISYLIDNGSDL